jgi:serine/threonine-protein kinase
MGIVLAGRHLELGEKVAIKFLHQEHAAHADRFFREARAAARLRTEHVVRIFDVGRLDTGEPYIAMEYLDGEDLASRLRKRGPMRPDEVADILVDVCLALAEAHAAGIVHRDLKPANIFLARGPGGDDLVKLLDFGVAKVPDAGSLTQTATVLGSPYYMSPEQLMASRGVDARSDIWSLGIILYELLTGDLPFEGDSLVQLGILVREKATPRIADVRLDVPADLDAVLARCLAKNREERFANVGEFVEALRPFVSARAQYAIGRVQRVIAEKRPLPERQDDAALAPTVRPPARALALASSETSATTTPGARKRRWTVAAVTVAAWSLVISVALHSLSSTRAPAPSGLLQSAPPPSTPVLTAAPLVSAPAVIATPVPAPIPTPHPPVARKDPPRPPATKPAPNCNPPYTIDEKGLRRPKSECL